MPYTLTEDEKKRRAELLKTHKPLGPNSGPYLIPREPAGTPARVFRRGREEATVLKYAKSIKDGEPLSLAKCAELCGYPASSASSTASRIEKKISNSTILQRKMEEWGVGIDTLARDLADIRNATLPRRFCKHCQGVGKHDPDEEGNREKCHHCNGLGYFDDPDNFVRLKNAELRAKLHDAMPSQKLDITEKVVNITFSMSMVQKVKETLEDLGE